MWKLLVKEKLGEGQYRSVYALEHMPDHVLKVEKHEGCFANVKEWDVWTDCREAPNWVEWLAPCLAISGKGRFLIQERTKPVVMEQLPKKIPAFLTDRKVGNWGRLKNGRIVCHDYGMVISNLSLRMSNANWWEH